MHPSQLKPRLQAILAGMDKYESVAKQQLEAIIVELDDSSGTLYTVTSDKSTAVSRDTFWMPMDSCPTGVKVQLHTKDGVAIYSTYTPSMRGAFIGWYPCPKRPDWLKAMLSPSYNRPYL